VKRVLILGTAAALGLAAAYGAASARPAVQSRIVFSADRRQQVSGVVYRVAPNGHRVVLAHGWWLDARPTVSTDGKTVAYLGSLKGAVTVYEVGIGGQGRVRVGPVLSEQGQSPDLAWQPHGTRLALTGGSSADLSTALWIIQRGRSPVMRVVDRAGALQPTWSADGRVVTVRTSAGFAAFTPAGRALWKITGAARAPAAWSPQGLVALATAGRVGVYSEQGRFRFSDPGQVSGGPAWSPAGMLAVVVRHRLEVQMPGGTVVLSRRVADDRQHGLAWDGNERVVVGGYGDCFCDAKSVDIRSGRFATASGRWFVPRSADGTLAIVTSRSSTGYALRVAPTRGGAGRIYTHVPLGYADGPIPAVESAQFAGPSRTLVYASYDPEPFQNLYSVSPGGGRVRELPVTPYATQPALSPDGRRIAYAWAPFTGLTCKGCASQIRVAAADGSGAKALTDPPDCTFDRNPAWSPDGTTILFSEESCDRPGELFTVAATGGTPHDLGVAGSDPAWGPSRIAYVGSETGHGGLWTALPDGGDPVKVAAAGGNPAWSPDGRLAYLEGASGRTVVVGSTSVHLPFAKVTSLAWSPDGKRFVVTASEAKYDTPDLYTIAVDGTDPVRVTASYDANGATW
jgi:Tol biopolymer transport system component